MLTVLLAPKLSTVRSLTRLDAARAGGLDLRDDGVRRANHEHVARRKPHGALGDRAQEEAPSSASAMGADNDQLRVDIDGQLRYRFGGRLEADVRRQAFKGRLARVRFAPAADDLLDVLVQAGRCLLQVGGLCFVLGPERANPVRPQNI